MNIILRLSCIRISLLNENNEMKTTRLLIKKSLILSLSLKQKLNIN